MTNEQLIQDLRDQHAKYVEDNIDLGGNEFRVAEQIRRGFADSYGSPAKQRGENLNPEQMRDMQEDRGHGRI